MRRIQSGTFLVGALLVLTGACSGGSALRGGDGSRPAGFLDRGTGVEVRVSENGSEAESPVAVGREDAWRVLPAVYDELGLGGEPQDPAARTYGNPRVDARMVAGVRTDGLFRCANEGAGPSRVNRFRVRFSVATTVSEEAPGRALLTTRVVAVGTPWEGTSSGEVICVSRGLLEAAIEEGVLARASGAEADHPVR